MIQMTQEEDIPAPAPREKRPMRILCLDGGGMKGVYACSYLTTLEDHFKVNLCEHFDLIAGTSTGGIIALGLGARLSASDVLKFYREHGSAIFPKHLPGVMIYKRIVGGHGYHGGALNNALKEVFKDTASDRQLTMADAATRLLIPAVNAQDCSPRVFKSHLGEPQVSHLKRDLNISMAEVAMATAAAPWFLPIAKINEAGTPYTYIDGGLWANNPSVIAITEALNYYVGEDRDFDSIQMLSIGLPSSSGFGNTGKYQRGMKLIPQLLSYAMESSKLGAHQTARFLLRNVPNVYFRVQPDNLTEAQSKRLKLDGAGREEIGELMMMGQTRAHNDKNSPDLKRMFD
ncbi:MAG: patatin-like phospholipase family protein [Fimbriimonadaceae bacterium]|nr:patatin-like phospholipase family protein [Fimbriimonadaceae bacterium]